MLTRTILVSCFPKSRDSSSRFLSRHGGILSPPAGGTKVPSRVLGTARCPRRLTPTKLYRRAVSGNIHRTDLTFN